MAEIDASKLKTVDEQSNANVALVKDKLGEFLAWGHINFESANGVIQSGCRAVVFDSAEAMNSYFEEHNGIFAAQIFPMEGKLVALCNRTLDEDDQLVLSDYHEEVRKKVAELKEGREKAKLDEENALKDRVAELERLQEIGKKCEHNHAAVIEDNQKLKSEAASLRKQVAKFQKASK